MRLAPVTKNEERSIRAYSLRKRGLKLGEIGAHPSIGPVSRERARQLISRGEKIVHQRAWCLNATGQINSWPMSPLCSPPIHSNVEELDLSVRANNCLRNANITTIGELVQRTEAELMGTKHFGKKSIHEIKNELHRHGLFLGMEVAP